MITSSDPVTDIAHGDDPILDAEIEHMKALWICSCGSRKTAKQSVCTPCFMHLPDEWRDRLTDPNPLTSEEHTALTNLLAEIAREVEVARTTGEYPPQRADESEDRWFYRLRRLKQAGVFLKPEDIAFYMNRRDERSKKSISPRWGAGRRAGVFIPVIGGMSRV